jgi:hypothetical protein
MRFSISQLKACPVSSEDAENEKRLNYAAEC